MDFLELAKQRFSCRGFSDKEVEIVKIEKILEAAKLAPTARNFQPQKILVLTEKEQLKKLSTCTQYGWNAPVVMIIFYDKSILLILSSFSFTTFFSLFFSSTY